MLAFKPGFSGLFVVLPHKKSTEKKNVVAISENDIICKIISFPDVLRRESS